MYDKYAYARVAETRDYEKRENLVFSYPRAIIFVIRLVSDLSDARQFRLISNLADVRAGLDLG